MTNKSSDFNEDMEMNYPVDHGMGTIRDSAAKAVLNSKLARPRTERKRKGTGSYTRKTKHQGGDL